LPASALAVALIASSCSAFGGSAARTISADFSRAFQLFPGVKVAVLGVPVGKVTTVEPQGQMVHVTMDITDDDVRIPAGARATVLPESLLGERYVQIWPAYKGGPALKDGANIPLSKTYVPAEGDEFLAAVNKYFSNLKAKTLTGFFANAAEILNGRGEKINRLIHYGADLIGTLSHKRDRLAQMIVDFNRVTQALAGKQRRLGRLIGDYNAVGATIARVRNAVAGTIDGLNRASTELASLLIAHRRPLRADIRSLTRTTRTLSRNIHSFAHTGAYATKLFLTAKRGLNWKMDWLRLGNQGQEIVPHILADLNDLLLDHLTALCARSGAPSCATANYWQLHLPGLFCRDGGCPARHRQHSGLGPSAQSLQEAIEQLPKQFRKAVDGAHRDCSKAKHPHRCRARKKKRQSALDDLGELLGGVLGGTKGLPSPLPSSPTDLGGIGDGL
jgi:virulence factor Mce-like protein